jgi:hypothetical protein
VREALGGRGDTPNGAAELVARESAQRPQDPTTAGEGVLLERRAIRRAATIALEFTLESVVNGHVPVGAGENYRYSHEPQLLGLGSALVRMLSAEVRR